MNHFANNGKEYLRKKDYRRTQGRSPRQVENSYKAIEWTFVGFILIMIIYLGCGVFGLEL